MEWIRVLQSHLASMNPQKEGKPLRAAVYTRVSTEDGLEQEFNSLDAQRDACLAFIKSQKGQGWEVIPDSFDDGGFTGANLRRPALSRLLEEIKAGRIDCVVTYKVDRLSRSLLDFVRMMETFDQHNVAYVSVTQQINSSTPMGTLMYHILLSFAQFERQQIAERTRDKMRAAKKRGKWIGGWPPLGYDVDPAAKRLVVNPAEAVQVREIFKLYTEEQSLSATLRGLEKLKIHGKRWLTKAGKPFGGRPFTKSTIHRMLTNILYLGKVTLDGEVYPGEHEAIIDSQEFETVKALLAANHRKGTGPTGSKYEPLLRGLLYCAQCQRTMIHATTKKTDNRLYRYYVCGRAMKEGWENCKNPSVPAHQIESFVVDQIRSVGSDSSVVKRTHEKLLSLAAERERQAKDKVQALNLSLEKHETEMAESESPESIEFHRNRIGSLKTELENANAELSRLTEFAPTQQKTEEILRQFTPVWDSTKPSHKSRFLNQIVARIEFDGAHDKLHLHLNEAGIHALANNEK